MMREEELDLSVWFDDKLGSVCITTKKATAT